MVYLSFIIISFAFLAYRYLFKRRQKKITSDPEVGVCIENGNRGGEIYNLNVKLTKAEVINQQLTTEKRDLEKQLDEIKSRLCFYEQRNVELEMKNRNLETYFSTAENKPSQNERRHEPKQHHENETHQYSDKSAQPIQTLRQAESLTTQDEHCDNKLAVSISATTLNEMKDRKRKLSTPVKKLQEEVKRYKREKEDLEKELQDKISECEQGKKENSSLKERVQQLSRKRVCVMCKSQKMLQPITGALNNMKKMRQIPQDVQIFEKKLTGTLSAKEADFEESNMIVMVAVSEPRNMLISDSEPSQLGAVYREAKKLGKHVFMVYTDTKYKDSLKDNQAYHISLKDLFGSQEAIGDLEKKNKFISVKVKEKSFEQKLTSKQLQALKNWITECSRLMI